MGPDFAWDQTKSMSCVLGTNEKHVFDKHVVLHVRFSYDAGAIIVSSSLANTHNAHRQDVFLHPGFVKSQVDALEAAVGDSVVLHGSYGDVHEVSVSYSHRS